MREKSSPSILPSADEFDDYKYDYFINSEYSDF